MIAMLKSCCSSNLEPNAEKVRGNYYASLLQGQKVVTVPAFTLESGLTLTQVPIAYSTWGTLNADGDNVLVICHALTGSSDALDWWRPLFGPGKSLDYTRYFIFCANVLGSPYGSASSLSPNPETKNMFGPTFPDTTIRDDVRIHKVVLDSLGVQSIAAVVGGSMGGMHTLEWPLCTPSNYVRNIVPIATSAYQGAWGISWGETQRQSIYADAAFKGGWYTPLPEHQPRNGLGTARMIGMLTYRSFDSFEARFGRKFATPFKRVVSTDGLPTPPPSDFESVASDVGTAYGTTLHPRYSAHSYLHYQAEKFLARFDANCYVHLTTKIDSHDVTRDRSRSKGVNSTPTTEMLKESFSTIPGGALVIGVESDLLFPLQQQIEIAHCLPNAQFVTLESRDGHDGFLLEFKTLNEIIKGHLEKRYPRFYEGPAKLPDEDEDLKTVHSVFGEVEDIVC